MRDTRVCRKIYALNPKTVVSEGERFFSLEFLGIEVEGEKMKAIFTLYYFDSPSAVVEARELEVDLTPYISRILERGG